MKSLSYKLRDNFQLMQLSVKLKGTTCWNISLQWSIPEQGTYHIRSLQEQDSIYLEAFSKNLSGRSKGLFCPYPWGDKKRLRKSFKDAIMKTKRRLDASYILIHNNLPVGHFFLWKIRNNTLSQKFEVQVPELGIAIVDAYQGKGLGKFAIEFLKCIAEHVNADAIELTTAISNKGGFAFYKKTGFTYTGMIRNPLEVDVTDAFTKKIASQKFRNEKQMVYIINTKKIKEVHAYLAHKREQSKKL